MYNLLDEFYNLIISNPNISEEQVVKLSCNNKYSEREYITRMSTFRQLQTCTCQNQILITTQRSEPNLNIQSEFNIPNQLNLRGVTKNGRCNWQIISVLEGTKAYLGTVDDIFKAAILYDIFSIQQQSLKAKTNFNYNKNELLCILSLKSLLQIKQDSKELRKMKNNKK